MVGRRRAAGATVPVCAALICAIVGQAQGQQRQTLAPTFVWSPDAYISAGPGGVTSRVSYETTAASAFAGNLLDTLLATHQSQQLAQQLLNATVLQQAPPQTVVLLVGKQVSTEALGQASAADALQPLRAAVEAAGSSMSLPYVLHKAGESIREVVAGHMGAQGMSTSLHQLGCSGDKEAASGAGLSALLASLQTQDAPQVIMVCSTEATVGGEMELLQALQGAVADAGHAHVMVYAAEPASPAGGSLQAVGRSLLQQRALKRQAKVALTYTCDARCESQVKLLEAVILAINLIVAVLVGTCMLHNLGTPTRFEMPKETTQREM